ncbi:MAG: hypothetical protein KKD92_16310 [Proteobacteria bacterium]|nr:hypothetical protein [Pseudomonadota bacterium]
MNSKEHLEQLRSLQITDKNEVIFHKHASLLKWIDNVAPLLKYNNEHYSLFMDAALKVSVPGISSRTAIPCLNIMKSVVNRAIIELENDIKPPKTQPKKETIKIDDLKIIDLIFASNYKIRILLISSLIAAFILGVSFGSSKLYKEKILPLIHLYKTQDTNNIEPQKATNPIKNE